LHRRGPKLVLVVVALAILASACGAEGPPPETTRVIGTGQTHTSPTPTPAAQPPRAELTAANGRVLGDQGSSCWNYTRGGVCADTDFIDSSFELPVRTGEELTLSFGRDDQPVFLQVQTYESPTPQAPSDILVVPKQNPSRFPADFAPGVHWLLVHSAWPEGDVGHYFKIVVS